jgi:hypothetical protein
MKFAMDKSIEFISHNVEFGIALISGLVAVYSIWFASRQLVSVKVNEMERLSTEKKRLQEMLLSSKEFIAIDKSLEDKTEANTLSKNQPERKKGEQKRLDPEPRIAIIDTPVDSVNFIADKEQFENEHLSNYYLQVLYQSKVSFWFSLIFASLGFLMIILSIFLYKEGNFDKSILSLISGFMIDGVSALFFVQSNKAQKAMGDFFEKLRIDKNNLEARRVCNQIENKQWRDITKIQISFKLAEIILSPELSDKIISMSNEKKNDS